MLFLKGIAWKALLYPNTMTELEKMISNYFRKYKRESKTIVSQTNKVCFSQDILEYGTWNPVHSLGKTLLAFALVHSVLQGQTYMSFPVSLDFRLLHSSPL